MWSVTYSFSCIPVYHCCNTVESSLLQVRFAGKRNEPGTFIERVQSQNMGMGQNPMNIHLPTILFTGVPGSWPIGVCWPTHFSWPAQPGGDGAPSRAVQAAKCQGAAVREGHLVGVRLVGVPTATQKDLENVKAPAVKPYIVYITLLPCSVGSKVLAA